MKVIKVVIEYSAYDVDKTFDYLIDDSISINKGVRVLVNFNNRNIIGYVIDIKKTTKTKEELENEYGYTLKYIEKVIDKEPLLDDELTSLAYYMKKEYFAPLVSCFQTMLPKTLKPKTTKKANKIKKRFFSINNNVRDFKLTSKQEEIYNFIKDKGEVCIDDFKLSKNILSTLIKKGIINEVYKEVYRVVKIEDNPLYNKKYILNEDQKMVYEEIISSSNKTFLIEGVTGSGKSEVYLYLSKYYLSLNKSVLMLVPEIVLTSQLASRFKHYFKDKLALLHSGLNEGEKYDEYRRIKRGEAKIVIGTRSAIFAPVKDLGIIIIDEEHSTSYKQENTPAYHTLDIATYRANYNKVNLVLGSATPSLESKVRALSGVYVQLYLPKRINKIKLPTCHIIDMKKENNIISKYLQEEINKRLAKKEQVILLLNRRGYAPYVRCLLCGEVIKCDDCNISLNYHKYSDSLKCHYCGREYKMPSSCPNCNSKYLKKDGYGTQKVEEMIKEMFVGARVLRMDLDSTSIKDGHTKIINKVINNEVDILIGTQMVAKGLNFPNVTLVGVLNADGGLNAADFRANERTFQLLVQVLGRSGRVKEGGEAIIQTYQPSNKTILTAARQDYKSFVENEIKYRKSLNYPPFRVLTYIEFKGKDFNVLDKVSKSARDYLKQFEDNEFSVLGPSVPYLAKIKDDYRLRLMLKYKNKSKTIGIIDDLRLYLSRYKNIKIIINVDPYVDV